MGLKALLAWIQEYVSSYNLAKPSCFVRDDDSADKPGVMDEQAAGGEGRD